MPRRLPGRADHLGQLEAEEHIDRALSMVTFSGRFIGLFQKAELRKRSTKKIGQFTRD